MLPQAESTHATAVYLFSIPTTLIRKPPSPDYNNLTVPVMPRQKQSKPPAAGLATKTLILDNGAHTIKAGYSLLNATSPPSLDN